MLEILYPQTSRLKVSLSTVRVVHFSSDISRLVFMDFEARHRLFIIGMAAIERNDTFTASCIHRLLGDLSSDQPCFLNVDVSKLVRKVPPAFDSSESSQFEVQSDPSVSARGDTRSWKRMDDDLISLRPTNGRAVWNPPPDMVAIYGAMLTCGVTLHLQPFITMFLAEAQIASAQLTPNSY
ncbi:hypothetical protein Q3G72_026134 [Acer saccharum]|nr:hypothetical protein Q3G72_026134 [Acer saccharum]